MKKITIITPCYNAERFIKDTAETVVNQTAVLSNRADLEYIICDGCSFDNTIGIIKDLKSPFIKLISEKDLGMYDALAKGLKMAEGDICAYINAGDYYSRHAFDIVLDIFEQKNVKWLTGLNVFYNENSQIVGVFLPYKYRNSLIKCGYYGSKLPYIQQESTFWHSSLNKLLDFNVLKKFKYAGDYYLWHQFSEYVELKIVEAYLGGFKIHKGQLSSNHQGYREEVNIIRQNPNIMNFMLCYMDKILWKVPGKIKKLLNKEGLFRYNHELQKWI